MGMRIMGIDPGGTTGVAIIERFVWGRGVDGCGVVLLEQIEGGFEGQNAQGWHRKEQEVGVRVAELVQEYQPEVVVIEDFILGWGSGKTGTAKRGGLAAVRVTSVVATWLYTVLPEDTDWAGCRVVFSSPSVKRGTGIGWDAKLRDAGLWVKGQRHAMDALIHALTFVK